MDLLIRKGGGGWILQKPLIAAYENDSEDA